MRKAPNAVFAAFSTLIGCHQGSEYRDHLVLPSPPRQYLAMAGATDQPERFSPQACRDARQRIGLSEADLARLAGISVASVTRFERGEGEANAYAARRILDAFAREKIMFVHGKPCDLDFRTS